MKYLQLRAARDTTPLAGMGAIGGNGHREDEFIDLSHQATQVKRAALLMYRLSQMDRSKPLQSASN